MNNEDHVIFTRERVEMEGAVAGGVSGEEHGSFKAGSSRFIAPMWTGGLHVSTRLYNACCIAGGRRCCYL